MFLAIYFLYTLSVSSALNIHPSVTCAHKLNSGQTNMCLLWWGYNSEHNHTVSRNSTFSMPESVDGCRPPRTFLPGAHPYAFKTLVPCDSISGVWTIGRNSTCDAVTVTPFTQTRACLSTRKCLKLRCKSSHGPNSPRCHLVNRYVFFTRVKKISGSKTQWNEERYPIVINGSESLESFYSYNTANIASIGSGLEYDFKNELKNRIWVAPLYVESSQKTYLLLNFDVPNDGSGGAVKMVIKYPASQTTNPIHPRIADDSNDNYFWNSTDKSVHVDAIWGKCCSDGLVLEAPSHGCVKFSLLNSVGLDEQTYAVVGVVKNSKHNLTREVTYHRFSEKYWCFGCSNFNRPHHTGITHCVRYDKCGVCGGDGKSCSGIIKCEGNHCSTSLAHQNKCSVKLNHTSNEAVIKVSGLFTYFGLKTEVEDLTVSDSCGFNWTYNDFPWHDKIYKRVFKANTQFPLARNCSHMGHWDVWLTNSHISVNKTVIVYRTPCSIKLLRLGTGVAYSTYEMGMRKCDVKVTNVTWIPTHHPTHPLIFVRTITDRSNGKLCSLRNPKILSFLNSCKEKVALTDFVIKSNSENRCSRVGCDYKKVCLQNWVVGLKRKMKKKCLSGVLKVKFDRYCNGDIKGSTIVDIYLTRLCKPESVKIVKKNSCKLYVSGPFSNQECTRLSEVSYPGDRVYYRIKSYKNMEIQHVQLCIMPPGSDFFSSGNNKCEFENCEKFVVYDKNGGFKKNIWEPVITPLHDQNATDGYSDYGFSIRTWLFSKTPGRTVYSIRIIGTCHKRVGGFSTKYLLDETDETETQFVSSVSEQYYGGRLNCHTNDFCDTSFVKVGCPVGFHFKPQYTNLGNSPGICLDYGRSSHNMFLVIFTLLLSMVVVVVTCVITTRHNSRVTAIDSVSIYQSGSKKASNDLPLHSNAVLVRENIVPDTYYRDVKKYETKANGSDSDEMDSF